MSWDKGKLVDIADEIRDSFRPDATSDIPCVTLDNVEPDSLFLSGFGASSGVQSNKYRFKKNDTLFGTMRPYFRKVVKPDFDGVCSTEFSVLRPKIKNDEIYLFYFVAQKSFIKFATVNSKGDRPRTKWKDYSQYKSKIPAEDVRKKIGCILTNYDTLIKNNYRRIELLEGSARLLYREWFVHLRFPGYEHTKITKGVPKGWDRTFVPDIIDVNPKTTVNKNEKRKFVEMASLSTNTMVVSELLEKEKTSGSKFMNGDTLFARITPCLENGKTAFVNFLEDNEVGVGSTEFIVLRPKLVTAEYVYCLARTHDFRENAIKSMIGSSGRQRVQVSCFDEYLTPLPSKILLEQFTSLIRPVFQQIECLMNQNKLLIKARDLLLPRLMNGDIAV